VDTLNSNAIPTTNPQVITKRRTALAMVPLNELERAQKKDELYTAVANAARVEAEASAKRKELGESVKTAKAVIKSISDVIRDDAESRNVEFDEELDLTAKRRKWTLTDGSLRVVKDEAIPDWEMEQRAQTSIPGTEPASDEGDEDALPEDTPEEAEASGEAEKKRRTPRKPPMRVLPKTEEQPAETSNQNGGTAA